MTTTIANKTTNNESEVMLLLFKAAGDHGARCRSFSDFLEKEYDNLSKLVSEDVLIEKILNVNDLVISDKETSDFVYSFIENKKGNTNSTKPIVETKLGKFIIKMMEDDISDNNRKEGFRQFISGLDDNSFKNLIYSTVGDNKEALKDIDSLFEKKEFFDNDDVLESFKEGTLKSFNDQQINTQDDLTVNHTGIVPIIVKEDRNNKPIVPNMVEMFSEDNCPSKLTIPIFNFASTTIIREKHIRKNVKKRIGNALQNIDMLSELSKFLGDDPNATVQFSLSSFNNEHDFVIVSNPRYYKGDKKSIYIIFKETTAIIEVR